LLNESEVTELLRQDALSTENRSTLGCGEEEVSPEFAYTSTLRSSVPTRVEHVKVVCEGLVAFC